MSTPRIVNAMNYIDDDLVADAVEYKRKKNGKVWVKWGAAAACMLIVAGAAYAVLRQPKPVVGSEPGDTVVEPVDEQKDPAEEIAIKVIPQVNMQGERIVLAASDVDFDNIETPLPEALPVYVNDHTSGEEGPQYEVTEDMRDAICSNLSRYLDCLNGEESGSEILSSDEYEECYISESTEIHSTADGISLTSSDSGISSELTNDELLENGLVKAAVEYSGMTAPTVTKIIDYNPDGTEYLCTYTITDSADNTLERINNRSFARVTVEKYADSDDVYIQIVNINASGLAEYTDNTVVSYSDVLEKLKSYYPDMDLNDVKAEIYYSSIAVPGYYVPCYRFYIKDGVTTTEGDDYYTVVDVVALNLDGEVTVTSLDLLKKYVDAGLFSKKQYEFLYDLISENGEHEEFHSVVIPEYMVTFKPDYKNKTWLYATVKFTVAESDLDTLPVGEYEKALGDSEYGGVWFPEEYREWCESYPKDDSLGYKVFCYLRNGFYWDTYDYGENLCGMWFHNWISAYYWDDFEGNIPVEDYCRIAEEEFGYTNRAEIEHSDLYNEEEETVYKSFDGTAFRFDILETVEKEDSQLVVVQLYSDLTGLFKSHKVGYRFSSDGVKWLGCEVIEESEYAPYHHESYKLSKYADNLALYFRESIGSADEIADEPNLYAYLVDYVYSLYGDVIELKNESDVDWMPRYLIPSEYMKKAANLLFGLEELPDKFYTEDFNYNSESDAFQYTPYEPPMYYTDVHLLTHPEEGFSKVFVNIFDIEWRIMKEMVYVYEDVTDEEWGDFSRLISVYPAHDKDSSVPDFLSEEQKETYKLAQTLYPMFGGNCSRINVLPILLEYDSVTDREREIEARFPNGFKYCEPSVRVGRFNYARYEGDDTTPEDIRDICLSAFTEEYWNRVNRTGCSDPRYTYIDYRLYYTYGEKEPAEGYDRNEIPDEFELIKSTDKAIEFNVICHYRNSETESDYTFTTEKYNIKMVLTDDGWRFSKFADGAYGHDIYD